MSKVRLGGPKDFWNRIKSISVADIAREAKRPLIIAVVGDEKARQDVLLRLMANTSAQPETLLPETPFVQEYASTSEVDGFPVAENPFDFVIDAGTDRGADPIGCSVYTLADFESWDLALERVFEDRADLSLALARNFPAFRSMAAHQIIQQTAMTNAEFSLITGVVSAFPIFDLLLPANALSDILVLTKNQIMMTLRLAAAYGLDINYKSRMKELTPILVNAFGWRAVARELVGAVPGVGFLVRAMISYAGTVTVGKAVQVYYESGETVTRTQAQRIYKDALAISKDRVRALADRVRRRPRVVSEAKSEDPNEAVD